MTDDLLEKIRLSGEVPHHITIIMDGRGRALHNIFVERLWRSVKHEDVYLKGYATMPELLIGLTEYFVFYTAP